MSVRNQILEDIKTAMKSGDTFKRDTLRTLNAALKQIEVDERIELSDERTFSVLQTEIKRRNEAAEQYQSGGRDDLVQKELKEAGIISSYLPKQLSDDELNAKIKEIISSVGAVSMKDMGKVMSEARAILGASCDGKRLSECVKANLS